MPRFLLQFLSAYFVVLYVGVVEGAPISSCSQTPHPEVCDYFIGNYKTGAGIDEIQFPFRERALRVTMNQAMGLHQLVSAMELSTMDERTKLARSDCLELYENSIQLVNRSINSAAMFDSQTWLSAAIANHHTCLDGFIDFNQSLLILTNNFSKLLSNSLAINKAAISTTTKLSTRQVGGRRLLANGFPPWVSAADRQLLQSSGAAPRADVVVAHDGSGNYKTISEAVAASVKLRRGSKRFVIYVKEGVYRENVEIKENMKNIMMIGDGKDATIVTGNKNVQDGSTTYRSATFGKFYL